MDRPTTVVHGEDREAAAYSRPTPEIRFWVVPHTHWDREWFIPFQVIRLKLVRMVDELMDTLEADPSFTSFTLDGQAVILEDYLAARPESRDRLTRLIQEGRIRIGPSYILPDEFLVGQESLVRNLLLGRQLCRQFGRETPVAYYPDTFGHVAQMPQIVRGFGMDSFVFWRGLGDDSDRLGVAFRWQGPDGSEVLAIRQIDGYGAVDNLGRWARGGIRAQDPSEYPQMALRRLKELRDITAPYLKRSGVTDLLAGNGTDHQLVQPDLPSLLSAAAFAWPEADFRIASLDQYADAIRHRLPFLDTYLGEMADGKDAPVLRGVNSARIHLKQRNEAVERALLEAEVAASLAFLAYAAPYPRDDLAIAWKQLLLNHPHDSICGCSVDEVHRDMAGRFDAAEQIALRLRREALWKLAGGEAIWSYRERPNSHRSAVNLLPWKRRGLVELPLPNELAHAQSIHAQGPHGEELPAQLLRDQNGAVALVAAEADALAASPIHLRSGRSPLQGASREDLQGARLVGYHAMENEHYHVSVLPNGTLEITHKASGLKLSGAHWFEDEADRGDEYNFCPLDSDSPWDSRHHRLRIRQGMRGPAVASLLIEIEARLPASLRADRKARRRETVACPIRVEVRLVAGVERVEFVTSLDNRAQDHRLRVLFPAGAAEGVLAEGHYAVIHRPVGAKEHGPDWKEELAPTHHSLGAIQAGGVLLLAKGLPEYEVRRAGEGTEMALTLLRSVGWLSRDDLSSRPGGAGPHLATPEAQCLGPHRFEYAIALAPVPARGADPARADNQEEARLLDEAALLDEAELVRASQDYRHGLLAGPPGVPQQPLLRLDGQGFCLSALKGAEDGDGVVLRLYNPGSRDGCVALSGPFSAQPCRLDEEPQAQPFDGKLPKGKIASFRLRGKAESPLPLGENAKSPLPLGEG